MDVLCIGETLVDIITHPVSNTFFNNDSTNVQEILLKTGGDALNNSVDLAVIGNSLGRMCAGIILWISALGRELI